MVTVVNDTVGKLLELLRSSKVVPEHVSRRNWAIWVPERLDAHESWETTRAFQIEHYEIRAELDAQMRRDGTKPTMVGFEAMLSGLSESDATAIEFHQLSMQGATFLVCTNVGTTRLIGTVELRGWD